MKRVKHDVENDDIEISVIGHEVFGLSRRARSRKLGMKLASELAPLLGDLRVEHECGMMSNNAVCIGCILMPEDVKRYILMHDRMRYVVVAYEQEDFNKIPCGCFVVTLRDDCSYEVSEFYVVKKYRRQGIGKSMFNEFVAKLQSEWPKRCPSVVLTVALWNEVAKSFYKSVGFKDAAIEMHLDGYVSHDLKLNEEQ